MSRFRNVELSPELSGIGVRITTAYSLALQRRADITFYTPERKGAERLPLLVLLHGVYGSHWNWSVLGRVVESAREMIATGEIRPFVIAMPSDGHWGDGTGYVPHRTFDAERWIIGDVPDVVGELMPEVDVAKLYLAGLSMGGYGAIRVGVKFASRVKGISAHSAVTRIEDLKDFVSEPLDEYLCSGAKNVDILHWAKGNRSLLPPLRFDCGREDSLLESNRALHTALSENEIPHTYEEYDGGHTWEYWQTHVRRTLRFVSEIEKGRH